MGLPQESIQLDAVEMVRRSERALGVAIRKGQDAGEIRTNAETKTQAGWKARGTYDQNVHDILLSKATMQDFAPQHELSSMKGDIFDLADDVTDEQFDVALEVAKEEGNLSRANVVRKVRELVDREEPGSIVVMG